MAGCVGVNSRIFKNNLQHAKTEDVPGKLGVPRLVVVEMSHHFSLLEIHIHSDRSKLRGKAVM